MNPFLKRTEGCSLVRQRAQANRFAVSEDHFQAEHHIGDPTVARHAVTDAALVDHRADDHGGTVSAEVGEHEPMLPERVMNGVDARAALGDDELLR